VCDLVDYFHVKTRDMWKENVTTSEFSSEHHRFPRVSFRLCKKGSDIKEADTHSEVKVQLHKSEESG
jgi:hypothetical protein